MPHLLTLATLRPDPDEARSWVETELHRAEYRQSLIDRFFAWLQERWDAMTNAALGANPLSTGAAVLVLVVVVVLVGLVVSRVRREPLRAVGGEAVLLTGQVTSEEHRRSAEAALADGAYDLAIVEAFRALAARAFQRGLVQERPGLTAHELATDLRPLFPGHAADLDRSSALFDLVFYGDQPATAADAQSVLDLEHAVRAARPARTAVDQPEPTTAVPR